MKRRLPYTILAFPGLGLSPHQGPHLGPHLGPPPLGPHLSPHPSPSLWVLPFTMAQILIYLLIEPRPKTPYCSSVAFVF